MRTCVYYTVYHSVKSPSYNCHVFNTLDASSPKKETHTHKLMWHSRIHNTRTGCVCSLLILRHTHANSNSTWGDTVQSPMVHCSVQINRFQQIKYHRCGKCNGSPLESEFKWISICKRVLFRRKCKTIVKCISGRQQRLEWMVVVKLLDCSLFSQLFLLLFFSKKKSVSNILKLYDRLERCFFS